MLGLESAAFRFFFVFVVEVTHADARLPLLPGDCPSIFNRSAKGIPRDASGMETSRTCAPGN